jgi:hypothetical protein
MGADSFGAFRNKPYPTLYGPNQTAVTDDKVIVGLIVAAGVLLSTLLIVSPTVRGRKTVIFFVKVGVSLFIGCVIIVSNYGYGWQNGTVTTRTGYKAFTDHEITAKVGLHIGLRGINITLKGMSLGVMYRIWMFNFFCLGEPEYQLKERINYNERFSWSWQQRRIGFGPYGETYVA